MLRRVRFDFDIHCDEFAHMSIQFASVIYHFEYRDRIERKMLLNASASLYLRSKTQYKHISRRVFMPRSKTTNFFKHSNKLISHLNKLGFVLAIFPLTSSWPFSKSSFAPKLVRTEVKYSISWGWWYFHAYYNVTYKLCQDKRMWTGPGRMCCLDVRTKNGHSHIWWCGVTFLSQLYQLVPRTATTTTTPTSIQKNDNA